MIRHSADTAEQVDTCFETPGKQSRSREEQIANTGSSEIEDRGRSGAFHDLEVHEVQVGADELLLCMRDVGP